MSPKKQYSTPELKEFGSVNDLTQLGGTHPGFDMKWGSVGSKGK